ncbi:hypothetical protein P3T76_004955 [Phytophthora citrophthora]|uniref:Uncharacterized protein n=1 Tax=Phytophthora citrophthora TaxID=4793 RepID=A0AAD9GR79_9STRA|nr:hypothetical protein P3T76_004955 [Phytophthora citrophthora]
MKMSAIKTTGIVVAKSIRDDSRLNGDYKATETGRYWTTLKFKTNGYAGRSQQEERLGDGLTAHKWSTGTGDVGTRKGTVEKTRKESPKEDPGGGRQHT